MIPPPHVLYRGSTAFSTNNVRHPAAAAANAAEAPEGPAPITTTSHPPSPRAGSTDAGRGVVVMGQKPSGAGVGIESWHGSHAWGGGMSAAGQCEQKRAAKLPLHGKPQSIGPSGRWKGQATAAHPECGLHSTQDSQEN
ncbi:hypothetical protein GCM10023205_54550 [Yinghuangia aomiensis]|uniref:Uncharacterized protein n=1 Tax=Yinghuangia aomiensis TaxID=676205 RepID=A0ABP9HV67_9ACTN